MSVESIMVVFLNAIYKMYISIFRRRRNELKVEGAHMYRRRYKLVTGENF